MAGSASSGAGMAQEGGIAGSTKSKDNTADPAPMAGKGKSAEMHNKAKANKKPKKVAKPSDGTSTDSNMDSGGGVGGGTAK